MGRILDHVRLSCGASDAGAGGAILFIGIACAACLGIVSFLGGYLIKMRIADRLGDR